MTSPETRPVPNSIRSPHCILRLAGIFYARYDATDAKTFMHFDFGDVIVVDGNHLAVVRAYMEEQNVYVPA